MNSVVLIGSLTRDPEARVLSNGTAVTQFMIATTDAPHTEYVTIVTWDRLAQVCARYLAKGMLVATDGRLQTREWRDDRRIRHWKTEIVATKVELLSGRQKRTANEEAQRAATADAS